MAVGQGALEDLVEEGRGDSRGSAWNHAGLPRMPEERVAVQS